MIKYSAVKFSRPNSVRLPIQYPHRTRKTFACPSLQLIERSGLATSKRRTTSFLDLSPSPEEFWWARISFSPNAQHFLSLCPFCARTSSQMKGPHQIGPLV